MSLFKSRKSPSATVSPLAPPARPFPPHMTSQGSLNGHGHGQGQGQGGVIAGPAYNAGGPMDRVLSYESGRAGSGSDKSEKRRSGFFGFGKKDKDKDKDKESNRARPSFSNDQQQQQRDFNPQSQPYPNGNGSSRQGSMSSMSPQNQIPQRNFPQGPGGQRIVSESHAALRDSDFGPYPSTFPKSQSMGFPQSSGGGGGGGGGVPDTHPYRGYLSGQQGQPERDDQRLQPPQQQQQQQQTQRIPSSGISRSESMPFDKLQPPLPSVNGHSGHTTPLSGDSHGEGPSTRQLPDQSQQYRRQPESEPAPVSRQSPQQRQQEQQPPLPPKAVNPTTSASASSSPSRGAAAPAGQPSWQREFNTIVDLIGSQPSKHYVASPPELEMILARTSAGGQPKQGQPGSPQNDWDQVWLQLSGISLSMWSMKETRVAAAKGEKVPPTYFNITDSSLELLAALPPPPHRPNSHPHLFVFSLNTAGSNRLLFSCPTEKDLARWTTALRLAAWERARLEEIYTGHLIKSGGREPKSELVKGRMEGWVRVRVMGGTEWKRLWLVINTPGTDEASSKEDEKKNKRRSFFGIGDKAQQEPVQEPNTGESMASFYHEPRTQKNRTVPAVLTITNVSQTYAVFPERLEVMAQSNLMKVVGRIHGELVTIEGRLRDSGWTLIMPEAPGEAPVATPPATNPLANMMRWVTGFHDVFHLYGRPNAYNWDQKDPKSLFFAYPTGSDRGRLFLDTDEALGTEFRSTHLPTIRGQFTSVLQRKVTGPSIEYGDEKGGGPTPRPDGNYRLPPLAFDKASPNMSHDSVPRSLTPITERTDDASRQNSTRTTQSQSLDRRASDAPSKQSSGGSLRHPPGAVDEQRLTTIADEGDHKQWTDEPEPTDTAGPGFGPGPDQSIKSPLTGESRPTIWSQETGDDSIPSSQDESGDSTPVTNPHGLDQHAARQLDGGMADHPSHGPAIPVASMLPTSGPSQHSPERGAGLYGQEPDLPGPSAAGGSSINPVVNTFLAQPIPTNHNANQATQSSSSRAAELHSPTPRRVASGEMSTASGALQEEPAATYLMNMVEEPHHDPEPNANGMRQHQHAHVPVPVDQHSPPSSSGHQVDTVASYSTTQPTKLHTSPQDLHSHPELPREDRVTRTAESSAPPAQHFQRTAMAEVGRRPSGARAPPPKKTSSVRQPPAALQAVDEIIFSMPSSNAASTTLHPPRINTGSTGAPHLSLPSAIGHHDFGDEVSAYVAYADQPSPGKGKGKAVDPDPEPTSHRAGEEHRAIDEYPSSFAPSKAAQERRAKAEAVAEEQERAKSLPGGGKRTTTLGRTTAESSGSEDEEEEEGSPAVIAQRSPLPVPPQHQAQAPSAHDQDYQVQRSGSRARALPPVPPISSGFTGEEYREYQDRPQQSHSQSRSRSPPAAPRQQPPIPVPTGQYLSSQGQAPAPQAQSQPNRQTVWNANFAAEHGMAENKSGKFVELEEPAAQLTKAFAPHGLLQAGMQDKEDRSAKKQEELARETGSSLINVPAKPPPPQTGLLGAVVAHEKERKNAGGIGATLTDREREKRLGEDRQRDMERMQRQQMEQMRGYGGDMYGGAGQGQQFQGYGMPPHMMMGMPPMGSPMGYPGYQSGYNPYAQQQAMMAAQMAYQQAMMSMSQAGRSQAGHGHGEQPNQRSSSPASASPYPQAGGGAPGSGYGYFPPPQPHMSMPPYGWPGMMPQWASAPSPPPSMGGGGGPGQSHSPVGGMRMSMPPGVESGWLHPNPQPHPNAYPGGGSSGHVTPERSRGVSMVSEDGAPGGEHPTQPHGHGPVS